MYNKLVNNKSFVIPADTYVRLTLIAPNGKEVAHSKTSVRRGQPNPLFKETFMFQVSSIPNASTWEEHFSSIDVTISLCI